MDKPGGLSGLLPSFDSRRTRRSVGFERASSMAAINSDRTMAISSDEGASGFCGCSSLRSRPSFAKSAMA